MSVVFQNPDASNEADQPGLAAATEAGTLRILTCGSVDDGKSTLLGRILFDSHLLMEDQVAELHGDSERHGNAGGELDLALLVDGLEAEREQGITIDVAYRYFATPKRRFIVADTPGHEQYTRNMVTGASTADLAILLVDAAKGLLTQTRRHAVIASLLGVREIVLAVNKMDLVGFDPMVFGAIAGNFQTYCESLGLDRVCAIPVSALAGDNITQASKHMPWYEGPSVLEYLESVGIDSEDQPGPLRIPIQYVLRPDRTFRGFAGRIASGTVSKDDPIVVSPSGAEAKIENIAIGTSEIESAVAGQSVTIALDREIDVSRGDLIADPTVRPTVSDQFTAHLVWMGDEPLLPGRPYWLKIGARTVSAQVTEIKYQYNVETLDHTAAKILELNDIGYCNLSTSEAIAFDPYGENRETGNFVLIDRFSNATVAAGMIDFALRRATNIHWQSLDVDRNARAVLKNQRPTVLWFTGLSGSGKSTIANLVEKKLFSMGRHTTTLDGDNVRHGLNRDLGFTDVDRVENIRRVAETAKLMADAGLIVLVSFISPFRSERELARGLMPNGEFLEIFVDTPIQVCRKRDPKGLYKRADAGEIKNFTGIDSPYELPISPDIVLQTVASTPDSLAQDVIQYLTDSGRLNGG